MDEFYDEETETKQTSEVLLPFLVLAFIAGIEQGQQQAPDIKTDDILTAAIKQAIQAKAFDQASLVSDTSKDKLKGLLQQAIDEGWGAKQLGREINTLYDDMAPYRSLAIARTEITSAMNDGIHETLDAAGYQQKTWSTVMDGHERDSHAEADGQTVNIDEPFQLAGGEGMYPGDGSLPPEETINCRCRMVAAGTPEDRRATLNNMFLRSHTALENRFVIALRHEFERQRARVLSHFPA